MRQKRAVPIKARAAAYKGITVRCAVGMPGFLLADECNTTPLLLTAVVVTCAVNPKSMTDNYSVMGADKEWTSLNGM